MRVCAVVVVLAVGLGLAACGGGESPATADQETTAVELTADEFVAAADAICKQNNRDIDELNPELAQVTTGPRDARLFDRFVEIDIDGTDQLEALGDAPAELLSGWERYLNLQRRREDVLGHLSDAIRFARTGAINRYKEEAIDVNIQSARQLRGLGFKECGSGGKAAAKERQAGAKIGDSLQFYNRKFDVTVTVEDVLDPLSTSKYDPDPDKGSRYVGIQMTIKNNGKHPFDASSPDLSSGLITSKGRTAGSATLLLSDPCGSDDFSAAIPPGQSLTGCVPFEVPEGAVAATFQYSPVAFASSDPGMWDLR